MSRLKFLMVVAIAATVVLSASATSNAAFTLTLPDGSTVNDSGSGSIDYNNNTFAYNGSVYRIQISSNILDSNLNNPASEGLTQTQFRISQVSGAAAPLTFTIAWDAVTGPTGDPLFLIASARTGATSNGSAKVTSVATPDEAKIEFSVSGNGSSASGFKEATVPFDRTSSPYTISQTIVVNLDGTKVFNLTSSAEVTAAPAPAGLVMLATALPFAGLIRRRLRKSEVATVA